MKRKALRKRILIGLACAAALAGSTALTCGCQCLLDAIADPDTSLADALKLAAAYLEYCQLY